MNTEQAYRVLERFCIDAGNEIALLQKKKQEQLAAIEQRVSLTRQYSSDSQKAVTENYERTKRKLDLFHTIAKEHTSLHLNDLQEEPKEPVFSRLSSLSASIEKYNYQDPKADELMRELAGNYRWLEAEQQKLMNKAETENLPANIGENEQTERIYADRETVLIQELAEQLASFREPADVLEKAAIRAEIYEEDFQHPPQEFRKEVPFFTVTRPVPVPANLKEALSERLPTAFDEADGSITYPYYATIRGGFRMLLSYSRKTDDVYEEISTLVLQMLRSVPPKQLKISLIDRVSYSQNTVRELLPLEGVVDPACSNENEINEYLEDLEKEYREIEKDLGSRTIHQFNKENAGLPYRLIILHENDSGSYTGRESLKYLQENAGALGITFVHIVRRGKNLRSDPDLSYDIEIVEKDGAFQLEDGTPVRLLASDVLPSEAFKAQLIPSEEEKKISNLFFDHVSFATGKKGKRKRGSVSVPFGVDDSGNLIEADFTNTNFAAFMEGSAGSGKSSLLHSIIMGLMMKYHPDEMELWLADFKMTEFVDYGKWKLPHVQCVLLESSEDLVFDLVDQLMARLNDRKVQFSKAGWKGIKDVPYDVYMPDIFVIIDEFGDMSKVLQQTAGEGADKNYREKVEYLLRESRSFGFHYIFANQAFTEGSQGLTEMAKLQIRSRFAMMNDRSEIRAILDAGSSSDERVQDWINNIKPFETLFRIQEGDEFVIRRYTNLYIPEKDRGACYKKLKESFVPQQDYVPDDDSLCVKRDLVMINGTIPQSFRENNPFMKQKEKDIYLHSGDAALYAGAPMSFERVVPFILRKQAAENILLTGSDPRADASVVRSILDSCGRFHLPCEIWADEANSVFESFGRTVFSDVDSYTELGEICARVEELKKSIRKKKNAARVVVVMGYERICNSLELMADFWNEEEEEEEPEEIDVYELMDRYQASEDPDERKKLRDMIQAYNDGISQQKETVPEVPVYDARDDIRKLVKIGPVFGMHFFFVFEKAAAFQMTRLDMTAFGHKLLFSMSRDDAVLLESGRQHPELLSANCFLYTDGQKRVSMRPYIVRGLPLYPEWEMDEEGNVSERKE